MVANSANNTLPSGLDPSAQPFGLLGIDPGATVLEIEAALAHAREMHIWPETSLAEAQAAILDPVRRLPSELSYPLGSTPDRVDLFFTELPADVSDEDILRTSSRLSPIARANFIARYVARRSASCELLVGLIDAHNSIDVLEIYQVLQALRYRAGWPPPSLASVRDGLNNLLNAHWVAAIGAYDPLERAAEPLLQSWKRANGRSSKRTPSCWRPIGAQLRRCASRPISRSIVPARHCNDNRVTRPRSRTLLKRCSSGPRSGASAVGERARGDQRPGSEHHPRSHL